MCKKVEQHCPAVIAMLGLSARCNVGQPFHDSTRTPGNFCWSVACEALPSTVCGTSRAP